MQSELGWLMPNGKAPDARKTSVLPRLEGFHAEELFRQGKRVAIADIPPGTAEQRPVVVAAHAAGVGPEWACAAGRMFFGPTPIILCPDDAPSTHTVSDIVEAASMRFGPYMSFVHAAYFGYSQGAMLSPAIWAAKNQPFHFETAFLLEGLPPNYASLPPLMHNAGIRKVFLVSGQSGWAAGHAQFARRLSDAGIEARHLALSFGHVPGSDVVDRLVHESAWLRER